MDYGTDHPGQIDSIGVSDGVCYLSIIQSEPLDGERTLLLQEKLNHYLAYVFDGQMLEEEPEKVTLPKVIRIYLQQEPIGVAAEFIENVTPALESEGIGLEINIGIPDV